MVQKIIASVVISASCTSTYAVLDENQAMLSLEKAVNYIAEEKYVEAYSETEWMLGQEGDYQVKVFYLMNRKMVAQYFLKMIESMEVNLCEKSLEEYESKLQSDQNKLEFIIAYEDVQNSWHDLTRKFSKIKTSGNPFDCKIWRRRLKEKEEKQKAEDEIMAARIIKSYKNEELCLHYGYLVRNEAIEIQDRYKNIDIKKIIKNEVSMRKIRLEQNLIKSRSFKIGNTKCQLYAGLGRPDGINRSVGPWGVHEQYVYHGKGVYIYFQNGRVTSFQD